MSYGLSYQLAGRASWGNPGVRVLVESFEMSYHWVSGFAQNLGWSTAIVAELWGVFTWLQHV
ncbi:hypothetical protein CRG98_011496 [Punica granatum]|uniref:Uncharacterized protein n=1 Tax=Punica granatum TaxID=22663 RepID=A0A2I0KHW1_PUNGR|nr:hypothetical protein CRG98_011496 [Punica granatum]